MRSRPGQRSGWRNFWVTTPPGKTDRHTGNDIGTVMINMPTYSVTYNITMTQGCNITNLIALANI